MTDNKTTQESPYEFRKSLTILSVLSQVTLALATSANDSLQIVTPCLMIAATLLTLAFDKATVKEYPTHCSLLLILNIIIALNFSESKKSIIITALMAIILVSISFLANLLQSGFGFKKVQARALKVIAEYASLASVLTLSITLGSSTLYNIGANEIPAQIKHYVTLIAFLMLIIAVTIKISIALDELRSETVKEIKERHGEFTKALLNKSYNKQISFSDAYSITTYKSMPLTSTAKITPDAFIEHAIRSTEIMKRTTLKNMNLDAAETLELERKFDTSDLKNPILTEFTPAKNN